MSATELRDDEIDLMRAIAKSDFSASADAIALRLGYRPARSGRLAVTARLRSLMRRHEGKQETSQFGECGRYVGRIPPKDRWGHARWFVTKEGQAMLTARKSPVTGNGDG